MTAHIVFAHPNLHSFNGRMRQAAIDVLTTKGWHVTVTDLYQHKFKAAADEHDLYLLRYYYLRMTFREIFSFCRH